MMKFLKRHSSDLSRKNSKGDKKDQKNSQDDIVITFNEEAYRERMGLVSGEDNEAKSGEIISHPCKGLSFEVGVSENKNVKYRRSMEDVHTYVANFCERLDWGYFAVFDGHAGKQTARWAGTNLHNILYESIVNDTSKNDLRENLNESFLKADEEIAKMKDVKSSGCTAAVAVLRWEEEVQDGEEEGERKEKEKEEEEEKGEEHVQKKHSEKSQLFDFVPGKNHKRILYTANVGDSRIVLNRGGKPVRLSYEHKGSDENETKRIHSSGGMILGGRVNGVLAVTRALGDVYLKQFVLGTPYTTMTEIVAEDECIIVACDGLWDVCSDEKAVELIRGVVDSKKASEILCQYAMDEGTGDNVTVMVVILDGRVLEPDV